MIMIAVTQIYLVTGGYHNNKYLSSTELLQENSDSWSFTGGLPTPRAYLVAATMARRLVVTGGSEAGQYYPDILEYRHHTQDWALLDTMKIARRSHAVSAVNWDDVKQYC